jgi:hypothetical protein
MINRTLKLEYSEATFLNCSSFGFGFTVRLGVVILVKKGDFYKLHAEK